MNFPLQPKYFLASETEENTIYQDELDLYFDDSEVCDEDVAKQKGI